MSVGLVSQGAFAQETAQRVEITGSSIKRVDSETALPVSVVTRADIEKSGVTSTEELLYQINTVSSAGGQVAAGQSGLATYGLSSVSLRGIGADKTLVLVNGRRLANFAGNGGSVNINAIPLAAIDRVEILQDGASGVYGSDAIAGVINFILRKDFKGVEISGQYGEPTRGGGAKGGKVNIVGGFGDYDKDRFSVVVSGSFDKETNLLGAARSYSRSDTNLPFYEGGATETGRIEGAWLFPGGATLLDAGTNARSASNPYGITGTGYGNPSAALGQCGELGGVSRTGKGFTTGANAATQVRNAPNCGFDSGPFVSLVPNRKFYGVSGNLRFKLSEKTELFAQGTWSRNIFQNPIQPAPLRQAFYAGNSRFEGSGVDPALLIYPSNPNYKFAADYLNSVGLSALVGSPLAVSQRTFLLGPRTTRDVADQYGFVVGAKGTVGNADYEVGYSFNQSDTRGSVIDGFASIFELTKVLNDPANNWNPWAPLGQQSPALSALIDGTKYVGPTITSKSVNQGIDGKISGGLFDLPAGTVQAAAGFQARNESYDLTPAAATLTGDIIGLGGAITPVTSSRTVSALFAEANVPVLKNLEGTLAIREDNYSDFGKTFNWKASGRYQPIEQAVLRGSYGTGFKAPSLVSLFTPQQINTSEQFIDPANPQNGAVQVTSLGGGNPNLQPEKSKQYSIGTVLSPIKQFSATIDFWSIKIDNLIATPSAQEIVNGFRAGRTGYASLVTVSPTNEIITVNQLAANVSSLKTQGIDVDLRFRESVAGGRLDIGLQGTLTTKYDLINASGILEKSIGTIVDPDGNPLVAAPTGVVLRWKHNANIGYSTKVWSVNFAQRFYKGYETARTVDGDRHFVKDQALYDLTGSYDVWRSLKLGFGVRNLFDKNPPLFINNGSQFQAGYDVYQYDPRGRFIYGTASYKF